MAVVAGEAVPDGSGSVVIARAAEVLRLLHDHPQGLSQTEIGERLGLPRSTVGRTLTALRAEGLVEPTDARGPYRLGSEILRMAAAARRAAVLDLHAAVEDLSRRTGETVEVLLLEGHALTVVDQVVADRRLRVAGAVGDSVPLHASAAGKAVLGSLEPRCRARLLPRRLRRFTVSTVVDRAKVLAAVAALDDGVATECDEHVDGVCAVAVVVPSRPDAPPMAVSVAVPTARFTPRARALAGELRAWVADLV
jgi:DNA-binding IclR family transcriptional regulator